MKRGVIWHSEINNIYARVDKNGNPYTRVVTNEYDNNKEYNCYGRITTDTVGIKGTFEETK